MFSVLIVETVCHLGAVTRELLAFSLPWRNHPQAYDKSTDDEVS